ncbi:MAG: exonuclease domain-containing protein [Pseudomonadota bacterium]
MSQPPAGEEAVTRSRPFRELPQFYYHTHFVEMLSFVERHYAHALRSEDRDFLEVFRGLPHAAQCLYVRLVNRKGSVLGVGKLDYPELGPAEPLIENLIGARLAARPELVDFEEVLPALSCADLRAVLDRVSPGLRRSPRKAELVRHAREAVGAPRFLSALDRSRWVVQRQTDVVGYLLFLFFGTVQQGTLRFTMRDLGIVRTQAHDATYEPRFASREDAIETWFFASRKARLRALGVPAVDALVRELGRWPEPVSATGAMQADSLAKRLGHALEQQARTDDALAVYRRGTTAHCLERQVRLLLQGGHKEAARDVLESCLDTPRSDEEWLFAQDLYARQFGGKRTSTLTDVLREAACIRLDQAASDSPERAVVDWFQRQGHEAWRAENTLWRTLFGLVFWDLLFGEAANARHSPFDALPAGLDDGSFYAQQQAAIEQILEVCATGAGLRRQIVAAATRYHGEANALFRWHAPTLDGVFALARLGDAQSVVQVLRELARDFRTAHGFPDLLVADAEGLRFVEVKTSGDQLRRNQLLRIEQLRAAGLRADVLRVEWFVDPEQAYVVVDVETTGGRSEHHRVTEIGAVRVVGGQIVDRFQTLIQPDRRIPASITRLTGISDAMVADAPRFADVASSFAEFLDGAIFVAHNVEFDYGFISREFRRLGSPFRMPKLCTCATMRRLFPGHASYSLKSLCADFDIALDQHHRALCDAEAAAGLLQHINDRREALGEASATQDGTV